MTIFIGIDVPKNGLGILPRPHEESHPMFGSSTQKVKFWGSLRKMPPISTQACGSPRQRESSEARRRDARMQRARAGHKAVETRGSSPSAGASFAS